MLLKGRLLYRAFTGLICAFTVWSEASKMTEKSQESNTAIMTKWR